MCKLRISSLLKYQPHTDEFTIFFPFNQLKDRKSKRKLRETLKNRNLVTLLLVAATSFIMKIICFNIVCYHTVITDASTITNRGIAEGTDSIAIK